MKHILYALSVAALVTLFTASVANAQAKFAGIAACKTCHNLPKTGKSFAKWESTQHAKAFKTLQTAEADKIAASKGFKTKAAETENCLSCHVTGMNEKGAQYDAKFTKDEGVGCESCHGAGSNYKTKHGKPEQMADAVKAGLTVAKVADGSAEKHCKTCHNEKSPTFKSFKFKEMWAKIAHPKPVTK